ncbi:MAG TPA: bifunctional phosphopantothenoylcysteine decarboxylase/phosphopantothenate--cysteine ligase CoaBC, partial [Xanthobacteraceae bacterium]|nr:bifunctional phosphopantothenoylcysteine decarboxylase/phosphopantothenate--cysteine ligase CoaBC [Xanthobacteraceae bacterium]
MASITIRQLDDDLKQRLRLRAARNGRSMEEEARIILGDAAALQVKAGAARDQAAAPDRDDATDDARPRRVLATGTQRVVLIIGGGIAAYKSLDLIRRLKERGLAVRCILTRAGREFITPLSASALSAEPAFTDLFDPTTEFDVGHIRLAREADLIVVAPATADLLARMAGGHADDLACAVLLATDRPILVAPAMNPRMWEHPATQRNLAQLAGDGVAVVGPNAGEMAEAGEAGIGRMAEPLEIAAAALSLLGKDAGDKTLAGKRIIVTSGPTHEPIDPVRYIANRSSGKQGHAIAAAAAAAGADVTLVTGPVNLPDPLGVNTVRVETAQEMFAAVRAALPAD